MTKKIKLVHLTTSLKTGGAEQLLCDLVQGLDREVFDQQVIYFHAGPHVATLQKLGVSTHQVTGAFFLYDPIFFIRLFFLLKRLQPDRLHTLLWSANVVGRLFARVLGIETISAVHNNADQNGFFRNLVDSITLSSSDRLIAVSDQVKESVINQHRWIPAQKVYVIPNGIDKKSIVAKAMSAKKTRADLGLYKEPFVIGSVGRFEAVKRYDLLLRSFVAVHKKNPLTRLVLVGIGSQEIQLKELAQDLGLADQVVFIVGKQAYGYYPLFDCFVQTSDKEGVSMALLEAMSCGVPCIITNVGMQHAVIKHGINGLVVPDGDEQELADALILLSEQLNLQEEFSAAGAKAVENSFNVALMVKKYAQLFADKVSH